MPNRKLAKQCSAILALFIITISFILTASSSIAEARPFLIRKPYDGFRRINSFYDHDLPNYSKDNASVTDFMGVQKSDVVGVNCMFCYNCYDGHSGIDYGTRGCDSDGQGGIVYVPIKAAATGTVFKIKDKNTSPTVYGNAVYLKHHVDGEDYITVYAHLNDHAFPSDWEVGREVPAGTTVGMSGGTGGFPCHLHFAVRKMDGTDSDPLAHPLLDPYGWWADYTDPSAGRENESGSYSSTTSEWLWGDGDTDYEVDDEDVSFQHVENVSASAIWHEEASGTMQGDRALWTYAAYNPSRQWDDWAIWVANIGRPGDYDVEVFIPDVSIGTSISTEAQYRVYHQTEQGADTHTDVSVDQDAHQGQWVMLGNFFFSRGGKAAVRLVDEVSGASNNMKAIWADAVRWEAVQEGSDPACTYFPDVPPSAWYYIHLMSLSCVGIVQGYPDGTFRPSNPVNRVELLKLAVETSGKHCCDTCSNCRGCIQCQSGSLPYNDIDAGQWYYPYLRAAYWGNWIDRTANSFHPADDAERMWVAEVLVHARGGLSEKCEVDGTSPFSDIDPDDKCLPGNIYAWRASEMGIFDGHPDEDCDGQSASCAYFCGACNINRAETVKVIDCAFFKDATQK